MIIDVSPKGSGKTASAVAWLKMKPANRIIVVIHEQEKKRVMEKYDLTYQQVETYSTIQNHYYYPALFQKELFIDNVEWILQELFHGRVFGFSATKVDLEQEK